ncbi:hypothetical protein BJX66DRAFT_176303 [Aspergillus keveii]|uniref:Uncharacterized protein n=1 Tax=Aspergillus keveii TaxID=714993 RepID=A0ABR4G7V8_9EURO
MAAGATRPVRFPATPTAQPQCRGYNGYEEGYGERIMAETMPFLFLSCSGRLVVSPAMRPSHLRPTRQPYPYQGGRARGLKTPSPMPYLPKEDGPRRARTSELLITTSDFMQGHQYFFGVEMRQAPKRHVNLQNVLWMKQDCLVY